MRNDYAKFTLFSELIAKLSQNIAPHAWVSYDDIQEMFGCSRRTAERMLIRIKKQYPGRMTHWYDDIDEKKRFHLYPPEGMVMGSIEEYDMFALIAATRHLKNKMLNMGLDDLAQKIRYKNQKDPRKTAQDKDNVEREMFYIDSVSGPEPEIMLDKDTTKTIMQAITNRKKVKFLYQGENHAYTVSACPLGILCGTKNNYLVAAENMNIEHYKPKTYALNKISNLKTTPEVFTRKKFDLRRYSEKSFGVFHSEHGPYNVEWLVTKPAVAEARRYTFHKTQDVTPNPDGTLTVKFRADGLREIATFLFEWGGDIIPIAPKELITEYKTMLEKAQQSLNINKI